MVRTLLDAAAEGAGSIADLSGFDEAERAVDATFLRSLLLGDAGHVAHGGFVVRGARIDDVVNLTEAVVTNPVHFDTCRLTQRLQLSGATLATISLTNCELAGVTAGGLRAQSVLIIGTDIAGPVEFSNAHITGAVALAGTHVEGDGTICAEFYGAVIDGPLLFWRSDGRAAGGRRSRFTNGAVRLIDVRVGAQLNMRDAEFDYPPDWALTAFNCDVHGSVFLSGVHAVGGMMFDGARVGGTFYATHARLTGLDQRAALSALGANIDGDVHLNDGLIARGRTDLSAATIGGSIVLSGGTFIRNHPTNRTARRAWDDVAVSIDGVSARAVFLRRSFGLKQVRCVGRFRAFGATIDGPFRSEGTRFQHSSGDALDLSRTAIGSNLRLVDTTMSGSLQCWGATVGGGASIDGTYRARSGELIELRGTTFSQDLTIGSPRAEFGPGSIGMEHCEIGARVDLTNLRAGTTVNLQNASVSVLNTAMIPGLELNGLHLTALEIKSQNASPGVNDRAPTGSAGHQSALASHLAFLALQPPQPAVYTRLALLAADRGDATYARRLRIERERRRWQSAPTRAGRLAGRLLDATIRYGFEPARILIWGFALVALFALFLWGVCPSRQFLVAVDKAGDAYTAAPRPPSNPLPEAGSKPCGTDYPCFNAVAYAFDTIVPLVNLGQREAWRPLPRGRTGTAVRIIVWLHQLAGWALATLFIAGFTRVVRHE